MLIRLMMLTLVLILAGSLFAQANPIPANPAQPNSTQVNAAVPDSPDWSEPFPPHRMIGNIYYVGSRGLASYLITTPAGHILINANLKSSVPLIRESIEKLGFHFADVKILLISHGHFDHDGGSAELTRLTGANYMVMDGHVAWAGSGATAS